MQRFLRDIAAGAQTLRFLTALVVSTLVTTAIATPMAMRALDNPASRAAAIPSEHSEQRRGADHDDDGPSPADDGRSATTATARAARPSLR